jgi:putative ABC transport system ATP-binding protein
MKEQFTQSQNNKLELSSHNPILCVQNLGRSVEKYWVWSHLSFQLFPGERVAVVGASGSGKSLLLRALAGLEPVQAGQIIFQGQLMNSWFMPSYRSQVIYLHQRPALLEGTVESNLQLVYRLAVHHHQVYNRKLILDYLHLLHKTADFLQRPISAISGGEAQIVAFLRALQLSPKVLLTLCATHWEAAHQTIKEAFRTGMIPTINSMMVMGLVSLPGMMTGQILAGASPNDAIRYQIVIIFAQASGTAIATIGVVILAFLALFNRNHQFTHLLSRGC